MLLGLDVDWTSHRQKGPCQKDTGVHTIAGQAIDRKARARKTPVFTPSLDKSSTTRKTPERQTRTRETGPRQKDTGHEPAAGPSKRGGYAHKKPQVPTIDSRVVFGPMDLTERDALRLELSGCCDQLAAADSKLPPDPWESGRRPTSNGGGENRETPTHGGSRSGSMSEVFPSLRLSRRTGAAESVLNSLPFRPLISSRFITSGK